MARPRNTTSAITMYRMNLGWQTPELAEQAHISKSSIHNLENGRAVTRPIMFKYLHLLFDMDLNQPEKLPPGWEIEDRGEKVVLLTN